MRKPIILTLTAAVALALLLAPAAALAQKYGGVLRAITSRNPGHLALHESNSAGEVWVVAPMYNNLVWFDTFQPRESFDTLQPELAESWAWNADGTALTFKLRRGVKWHDGTPFTSKDVKFTWDVIRGASKTRIRLNPRKLWYFNVTDITTNGDYEVTFHLKRRQRSLLMMLAAGYEPVYPAHIDPNRLRTEVMGTGPFKLQEYKPDQRLVLVKNQDYFKKGRPYLDGITYSVIRKNAGRVGALVANQVDLGALITTPKPVYDSMKGAKEGLTFLRRLTNTTVNILFNTGKPPYDNPRLREAISLAMDRQSLIKTVFGGDAVPGGAMIPAPEGRWGLTPEQLKQLPGYGDPAANKAKARKMLAELGYNAQNPLKMEVKTANRKFYVDPAVWAIGELEKVGVKAELVQVEAGTWSATRARKDFLFAMNATAVGIDDPDAVLYENYKCGSQRNYGDYCNPAMEKLYDEQSMETDTEKRRKLVQQIDMRIQKDGVRPMLVYRIDYYPHYDYVKNYIPHQSIYNAFRMEEVWLDK